MDMPDTLIDWLTESRTIPDKPKRKNNRHNEVNTQISTDIKYIVRDDELDNILKLLPSKFLHNYSDWISVLTAFKRLGQYEIFDRWSRSSPKYNNDGRHNYYWNNNHGVRDISGSAKTGRQEHRVYP